MFKTKTHRSVATLVLGVACLTGPSIAPAATPLSLPGTIAGIVTDPSGIPRMGASVLIYNRQDRLLGRALTDSRGEFRFPGLLPSSYSIRVTLATFVPALRKDILVQPGMRSILNVNLNSLFSTIQAAPLATRFPSDWSTIASATALGRMGSGTESTSGLASG